MKKLLSVVLALVLCLSLFSGCKDETDATSSASKTESKENKETKESKESKETKETNAKIITPLPETLDINNLDDCTVAVSLEEGDAYVDDSGKMVMDLKVYSYEVYDMVDISTLGKNDIILRRGEKVKVTELERLDSGLVRINGGEENGGFDLISHDSTVYYENGMNDAKAYYELGEITLPVSVDFEYIDSSDLDAGEKKYFPGDFLTDSGIEYYFFPRNTSVVIADGYIVKMNRCYVP